MLPPKKCQWLIDLMHWTDWNTPVKRSPEAPEVLSIQVVQPCPAHFDHPKLLQYQTVPTFVILSPSAPQSAFSSCRIEAAVANRVRDLVLVRSYGSTNLWLVSTFTVLSTKSQYQRDIPIILYLLRRSDPDLWSETARLKFRFFVAHRHSHLPWSAHICLEVLGRFSKCKWL